jgi:Flp pilus assembly protein TadB
VAAPAKARVALAAAHAVTILGEQAFSARSEPAADSLGDVDTQDAQQIVEQLNEYYAANISQGYAIFWASLLATVIGFAVILAGIDVAGTNPTTAIVAGVAGVLSQFIAATFLVALRSTQQQSTAYAQTLADLRIRELRAAADARDQSLALRLLAEISGDGAQQLANVTRATIAAGLMARDGAPAPAPPAPPAPAPAPAPPAPAPAPAPPVSAAPEALVPRATTRMRAESIAFDTADHIAEPET